MSEIMQFYKETKDTIYPPYQCENSTKLVLITVLSDKLNYWIILISGSSSYQLEVEFSDEESFNEELNILLQSKFIDEEELKDRDYCFAT